MKIINWEAAGTILRTTEGLKSEYLERSLDLTALHGEGLNEIIGEPSGAAYRR